MAIEIEGILERKLSVQSGTSARGPWKKQDFLVRTEEAYPRTICMNVWGEDKVNELASISDGSKVKVSVNIESREFNGRWYTDVRAWRIEVAGDSAAASSVQRPASGNQEFSASAPAADSAEGDFDDLPF